MLREHVNFMHFAPLATLITRAMVYLYEDLDFIIEWGRMFKVTVRGLVSWKLMNTFHSPTTFAEFKDSVQEDAVALRRVFTVMRLAHEKYKDSLLFCPSPETFVTYFALKVPMDCKWMPRCKVTQIMLCLHNHVICPGLELSDEEFADRCVDVEAFNLTRLVDLQNDVRQSIRKRFGIGYPITWTPSFDKAVILPDDRRRKMTKTRAARIIVKMCKSLIAACDSEEFVLTTGDRWFAHKRRYVCDIASRCLQDFNNARSAGYSDVGRLLRSNKFFLLDVLNTFIEHGAERLCENAYERVLKRTRCVCAEFCLMCDSGVESRGRVCLKHMNCKICFK